MHSGRAAPASFRPHHGMPKLGKVFKGEAVSSSPSAIVTTCPAPVLSASTGVLSADLGSRPGSVATGGSLGGSFKKAGEAPSPSPALSRVPSSPTPHLSARYLEPPAPAPLSPRSYFGKAPAPAPTPAEPDEISRADLLGPISCAEGYIRIALEAEAAIKPWERSGYEQQQRSDEKRHGKLTGPAAPPKRGEKMSARPEILSSIVEAESMLGASIHDVVGVGHEQVQGEVIAVDEGIASIILVSCNAVNKFLRVGDPVVFTVTRAEDHHDLDHDETVLRTDEPPPPRFKAVYEVFMKPPPGASSHLPDGLEWSAEAAQSERRCRIPAKWELHVVDESAGIDWKHFPVSRKTSALELRRALAAHLERSIERVVLVLDRRPLSDNSNAESLKLFERQAELRVAHANPWWMRN